MADKAHNGPSTTLLYGVFAALLVLLGLALLVPLMPDTPWRPVAAMGIAALKMALIILFFMQVRYRGGVLIVFVVGGFFWLLILFLLTFADYLTR